jgi:hypothetical protein
MSTMYNPVSQDLLFQQLDELRADARRARLNSNARKLRRQRAGRLHTRRTR